MPTLTVATTRRSEQFVLSGDKDDITTAVVADTAGEEYDASICDTADGKERLKARARAAYVLDNTHEPSALGFQLDQLKVFVPGDDPTDATGNTAVLITPHINGDAFQLSGLTEAQCAAAGTSIGAIHRLRGKFIVNAHYPAHASAQIHQQLEQWITSLKAAGHIPGEILKNWTSIISNENLWNFRSCPVHGGFSDGDILFTSTGVSGIRHWEDMQINDPARDLAWIFTELDPTRRNSVIAAYARIMGKRMDDMIMLRAGLWVQMSQVGDFIRALERADTQKIMRFKSQVESLAHEISLLNPSGSSPSADPSTLTVGDLLSSSGVKAGARSQPHRTNPGAPHGPSDKGSSPDRGSAPMQEDTRLGKESPLPEASSRHGYSRFVAPPPAAALIPGMAAGAPKALSPMTAATAQQQGCPLHLHAALRTAQSLWAEMGIETGSLLRLKACSTTRLRGIRYLKIHRASVSPRRMIRLQPTAGMATWNSCFPPQQMMKKQQLYRILARSRKALKIIVRRGTLTTPGNRRSLMHGFCRKLPYKSLIPLTMLSKLLATAVPLPATTIPVTAIPPTVAAAFSR